MLWGTNFEKFLILKKKFFFRTLFWKKNSKKILKHFPPLKNFPNFFWVSKNFSKLFPHNILHFFENFLAKKKVSAKLSVFQKRKVLVLPWNKDYLADSPQLYVFLKLITIATCIKNWIMFWSCKGHCRCIVF